MASNRTARIGALAFLIAGAVPAWAMNFAPVPTSPDSAGVARFVRDGGVTWAQTGAGLYRTTDGNTWSAPAGQPPGAIGRFTAGGGLLYVFSSGRVLSSGDDGATWTDITGGIQGSIDGIWYARNHVFVSSSEFVNGVSVAHLYRDTATPGAWKDVTPANAGSVAALVQAGTNLCMTIYNGGVRYSTDGGLTWLASSGLSGNFQALEAASDGSVVLAGAGSASIRRSLNGCQSFTALPGFTEPATLRSLGIDNAGNYYAGFDDGVIMRSGDGGSTFVADNTAALPKDTRISITDFHTASGMLLAGTGGMGAFRRVSGKWRAVNDGLGGANVSAILPGASGSKSMDLGLGGGFWVTDDVQVTPFTDRSAGLKERGVNAVARVGTTLLAGVTVTIDFSVSPATGPRGLYRSTDEGATWTRAGAASGLPAGAAVGALVSDGTNAYASVDNAADFAQRGLYKSSDGGLTWALSTNNLPFTSGLRNLAVRGTTLYAYIANQGVFRSTNAGASWEPMSVGLSGSKFGKVFAASNVLIASAGGVVYRSTDDAASWTPTTGFAISRFGIELLSMAEDAQGNLYLGDEHAGLSVSKDGGATWTPDSDGLPPGVCINRINQLLVRAGQVYVGIGGHGLYASGTIGGGTPGDSVPCTTDVDFFPNNFSFADQNNVTPDTQVTSASITVSGLAAGISVPIHVDNGQYSIGCSGGFTSADGTIMGGQSVCVRHRSALTGETATTTRLTIGDPAANASVTAGFTSRTGLVYTGAPDEINTSFGSNGFATAPGVGAAADVVVLADGRMAAVGRIQDSGFKGDFGMAMFNADGTPDATFGSSGVARVDTGGDDNLVRMIPLATGKFMLVGWSLRDNGTPTNGGDDFSVIALARLNADGSLDGGFGSSGVVLFDIHPSPSTRLEIVGDAVRSGSNVYVSGGVLTDGAGAQVWAVKFNGSGVVDTSFGSNSSLFADGVANFQVGSNFAEGNGIVVQPDDKVVIAGRTQFSFSSVDGVVVRLNADGTPDTGFGSNGLAQTGSAGLYDLARAGTGKLYAVGQSRQGSVYAPTIVRLNDNGTLDTTYDGDGVLPIPGLAGNLKAVEVLSSRRVAVLGSAVPVGTSGDAQMLYARLGTDGTLVRSFGTQGYVLRGPVNGSAVSGGGLAERADGGVVIGGGFGSGLGVFVFGGAAP